MHTDPLFRYFYLPWAAGLLIMTWVIITQVSKKPLAETSLPEEVQPIAEIERPMVPVHFTMPFFPGCSELRDEQKRECSRQRMYDYIYGHTAYPAGKPIHKSAGIVVANFVITPEGKIKDIRLLREPKRDQGRDVVRILKEMEDNGIYWEPATRNGRPTSQRIAITVRYNMVWATGKP